MAKRVAVLVRERQEEGLRVALGLTLAENEVEVYVLDRPVDPTDANRDTLAALEGLGMPARTTCRSDPGLDPLPVEEVARRILACDHVLAY